MERLAHAHEHLDGPLAPGPLAGNLRDLARVNRWLGGVALSRRSLARLMGTPDGGASSPCGLDGTGGAVRLLDVGTGAADIPAALLAWADATGLRLDVEALDVREEVVAAARDRVPARLDLRLVLAKPGPLPYADDTFDVAHASLVLHHLEPPEAVGLLSEMARVARCGIIVNDLDRRRSGWLGAWVLTRVLTGNRYTRHDAPLSVRRAYRPAELVRMAGEVGLRETARMDGPLGHRYALAFVREARAGEPERG